MVPRKDRPLPEDLEGYVRQSPPEPDFTLYRRELGDWLADHRREEEEKRENESNGRQPLFGHEQNDYLVEGGRRGFNRDDFDMDKIVTVIKSRPHH